MSSEDYLTRYFQQLAKVLAALMGLYEKKKYQQAIEEINQVLDTWFAMPAEEIDGKTAEELVAQIMKDPGNQLEKVKSVAELLYQKAISQKAMNKMDDAALNAQKAFHLFKKYDEMSGDFSIEIQQRIAELDQLA